MQGSEQLLAGLAQIDPHRPYGAELFNALARLTVSVAVEAVCLRLNPSTQKVEVYMTQRSPTDTAYPGEWHCPGSFLRPREEIKDVFDRLSKREFNARVSPIQFIANVNWREIRGNLLSVVYLCTIETGDFNGRWYPVDQLPEKTVECHRRRIIPVAVGAFVAGNTKICV